LTQASENKLIAFSWATNKIHWTCAGVTHQQAVMRILSAEVLNLWHAPDFRLMVVAQAEFGDTIPGFKGYWTKAHRTNSTTLSLFGSWIAIFPRVRLVKQSGVSRAQDHDNRFG
jgi:hypothetical protein